MRIIGLVISLALLVVSNAASAMTLKNSDGAQVTVAAAPELGDKTYLMLIENMQNDWAGKVFEVQRRDAPAGGARYSFSYDVALSSGKQTNTYEVLVEQGSDLKAGSRVPVYALHVPGGDKPVKLWAEDNDTASSNDLMTAYKDKPFHPVP